MDPAAMLFAQEEQPKRPTADKSAVAGLMRCAIAADSEQEPCSICLDEFEAGDEATKLPCGHLYHPHCVGKWLEERDNRCPVCRYELPAHGDAADAEGGATFPPAAAAAAAAPGALAVDEAGGELNELDRLSVRELMHLCSARGLREAARACVEKNELVALLRAFTVNARRHPQ
jgi:hypothetical protein